MLPLLLLSKLFCFPGLFACQALAHIAMRTQHHLRHMTMQKSFQLVMQINKCCCLTPFFFDFIHNNQETTLICSHLTPSDCQSSCQSWQPDVIATGSNGISAVIFRHWAPNLCNSTNLMNLIPDQLCTALDQTWSVSSTPAQSRNWANPVKLDRGQILAAYF